VAAGSKISDRLERPLLEELLAFEVVRRISLDSPEYQTSGGRVK